MTDENPVMGPVTAVLDPEEAAELSILLQHVLHNYAGVNDPRPDQQARAHYLGQAAVKLAAAMIQAMKDAGIPDEMIQRAMGNLQMTPVQTDQVEQVRGEMQAQLNGAGTDTPEMDDQAGDDLGTEVHPLDQADEPKNLSPGIDFPAEGGPPSA